MPGCGMRGGGVLSAFEGLDGALVAVLGADVLAGASDPPGDGEDGRREQDCDRRNGPPNQDREHESAD